MKNLDGNFDVERVFTYTFPEIIGLGGLCKIEVAITPNNQIKEGGEGTANNVVQSVSNLLVEKRLQLSLNKSRIFKNSAEALELTIRRSGDATIAEELTIESSEDTYFDLPKTIIVPANSKEFVAKIALSDTIPAIDDQLIQVRAGGFWIYRSPNRTDPAQF